MVIDDYGFVLNGRSYLCMLIFVKLICANLGKILHSGLTVNPLTDSEICKEKAIIRQMQTFSHYFFPKTMKSS